MRISYSKTDPILSSSMRQVLFKCETPRLELKSSRSFLAIKRCQRTKIGKVIKLARSSKKSGRISATIVVKLLKQGRRTHVQLRRLFSQYATWFWKVNATRQINEDFIFRISWDRDWIVEPSKERQRMLMQKGIWHELWVQEERYEVLQWMCLQWQLLLQRRVRGGEKLH